MNVLQPPVQESIGNAERGHLVLVSLGVLVGVAFVFQGIGNANRQAHTLILALLVGVVLLLGMQSTLTGGTGLSALAKYPWLPPAPPAQQGG